MLGDRGHGRLRCGLLGAGLTVLAAAVPATAESASGPVKGATYTSDGGTPVRGGSARGVSMQVSADGRKVKYLYLSFYSNCRVPGRKKVSQLGLFGRRNMPIRKGRVSFRRAQRYPTTGGSETTRLVGRFVDGGARFVGTVRQTIRNPQIGTRCDSGNVPVRASVPLRVLLDGTWRGTTQQGRPVQLTIGRQGVRAMSVPVAMTCANGDEVVETFTVGDEALRVDERGRFTGRAGRYPLSIRVEGNATRTAISGTVTGETAIERGVDEQGDALEHSCKSGPVGFTARRA